MHVKKRHGRRRNKKSRPAGVGAEARTTLWFWFTADGTVAVKKHLRFQSQQPGCILVHKRAPARWVGSEIAVWASCDSSFRAFD